MSYITTKNQYITVQGNQIAYRELSKDKSKLPLLMLVHLAATLDNWDPRLLDLIAEKHHVIVVDLPGVGASQGKVAPTIPGMAEQTIAFIQALGYDKINLLGLSMGGMITQEMVRSKPDLVNCLIFVVVAVGDPLDRPEPLPVHPDEPAGQALGRRRQQGEVQPVFSHGLVHARAHVPDDLQPQNLEQSPWRPTIS